MKNILLYLLIVLIAINLLLNFKLNQAKKESQYDRSQYHFYSLFSKGLKFNNRLTYQYQNSQIADVELIDENGDNFQLSDILNKKTLIIRYSHLSCTQCVDSIFSIINSIAFSDCLVLAEYDNPQSLGAFFRTNQPEYPIFNCRQNVIPFDTLNTPYAFITDSNLRISSFFIPAKEDMEYTKNCFNALFESMKE